MPDQKLTIWGRANSVNVQKVLWCLAELDLPYERIDAGMSFGRTREAGDVNAEVRGAVDKNGYSLFRIGLSLSEIPKP